MAPAGKATMSDERGMLEYFVHHSSFIVPHFVTLFTPSPAHLSRIQESGGVRKILFQSPVPSL
jgi:hypothetical protein